MQEALSLIAMQEEAAPAAASGPPHLPPGFRFQPNDDELINQYLRPRLLHQTLAPQYLIQERDIYEFEPWDLAEEYKDSFAFGNAEVNEMYFFTPRHPAGNRLSGAKRASRTTKRGLWDGRSKDTEIKNRRKEVIGHKVQLNFKLFDGGKKVKTPWLMHEYRLHSSSSNGDELAFDDLALCRIYKKKSRGDDGDHDANCEEVVGVEEPAAVPVPVPVAMVPEHEDEENFMIDVDFGSMQLPLWEELGDSPIVFDEFGRMQLLIANES